MSRRRPGYVAWGVRGLAVTVRRMSSRQGSVGCSELDPPASVSAIPFAESHTSVGSASAGP